MRYEKVTKRIDILARNKVANEVIAEALDLPIKNVDAYIKE